MAAANTTAAGSHAPGARRGLVYTGIDIGTRTLSIVSLRAKANHPAGALHAAPSKWMKFDVVGARLFDLTGGAGMSAWDIIRALQTNDDISAMISRSDVIGIESQFVSTGMGRVRGSVTNVRIETALSVIARHLLGDANVFSVLSGAKLSLFSKCVLYKVTRPRENLSQSKRAVQARRYNANKRHSIQLADSALMAQGSDLKTLMASIDLPATTKKDDIADAMGIALVLLHRGLTA